MVITPLIWAFIIGLSSLLVTILRKVLYRERKRRGQEIDSSKPFAISQYYGRAAKPPYQILEEHEQFIMELQEEKEKQEIYEIVLWWGLDGLKLKDDGTTEWISRRKPEPIKHKHTSGFCTIPQGTFNALTYESGCIVDTGADIDNVPKRVAEPFQYSSPDMSWSAQAYIDYLQAKITTQRLEAAQHAQNMALHSMLQNSLMPYDQYPTLMQNYGTVNLACAPNSTVYSLQATGCCCDGTILR